MVMPGPCQILFNLLRIGGMNHEVKYWKVFCLWFWTQQVSHSMFSENGKLSKHWDHSKTSPLVNGNPGYQQFFKKGQKRTEVFSPAPNAEVRCNVEVQNVKEAARGAHGSMLVGTQWTFNLGKPTCGYILYHYSCSYLQSCIWHYVGLNFFLFKFSGNITKNPNWPTFCVPLFWLDPGKVARMLLDGNTHLGRAYGTMVTTFGGRSTPQKPG